jgi:hypothetical protein
MKLLSVISQLVLGLVKLVLNQRLEVYNDSDLKAISAELKFGVLEWFMRIYLRPFKFSS